ncbi:DUF2786 domain-containing protein [Nocardia africana]|uniref:DUF2786 domain-containing protein n=1 Tax=Nocardia africana TaxID=134964 RepID=UPI0035568EB6
MMTGSDKLLTRIGALMRQAEGTDNPHEAEAFLSRAQQLATQHSIDLAVARAAAADRGRARPMPGMRRIEIGAKGTKGLATYVALFAAIAHANDVRVDAAHNSTWVIAFGLGTDIDTTQLLYTHLLAQMVRGSRAYLHSAAHQRHPVAGVTARLAYQRAFAARVGQRLRADRDRARADALATDAPTAPGTALALRDKDIELRDYYTAHSAAKGTWAGHRRATGHAPAAADAGDRDGQRARLHDLGHIDGPRKGLPS